MSSDQKRWPKKAWRFKSGWLRRVEFIHNWLLCCEPRQGPCDLEIGASFFVASPQIFFIHVRQRAGRGCPLWCCLLPALTFAASSRTENRTLCYVMTSTWFRCLIFACIVSKAQVFTSDLLPQKSQNVRLLCFRKQKIETLRARKLQNHVSKVGMAPLCCAQKRHTSNLKVQLLVQQGTTYGRQACLW